MKNQSRWVMALAIAAAWGLTSNTNAAVDDDSWNLTITPYLWLPSVDASLNVNDDPVEVDVESENEIDWFDNLDFAFLVGGELRKGKIGLVYDVQYIKFSDGGTAAIAGGPDFDAEIEFFDTTLALGYRFVENEKLAVTGVGGARIMWADIGIDIDTTLSGPGFSGGQDKTWVDPIVGALIRYRFNDKWGINAYGDIGGFGVGSDLTYTLMGTVSYNFTENFAIQGGYRYWSVDFEDGDFKLDAVLHGPLVGLTFIF